MELNVAFFNPAVNRILSFVQVIYQGGRHTFIFPPDVLVHRVANFMIARRAAHGKSQEHDVIMKD